MKLPALNYVFEQDWILSKCVARKVLHLGCAGDALMHLGSEASLHVKLFTLSKALCGVELNETALAQLKEWCPASEANNYFIGNVESLDKIPVTDKFDIIVAGSIIEHLSNPGHMLEGLARFCHKDTLLLISTPHVWGLIQYLRVAFRGIEAVNPEHTCWYSIPTLSELVSRSGFVPIEFATGYGYYKPTFKWKVKKALGSTFFKVFPQLGGSLLAAYKFNYKI